MFMPPLSAYSVILGVKIIIIRIIFGENYTLNKYLLHTSDRLFRQSERSLFMRPLIAAYLFNILFKYIPV